MEWLTHQYAAAATNAPDSCNDALCNGRRETVLLSHPPTGCAPDVAAAWHRLADRCGEAGGTCCSEIGPACTPETVGHCTAAKPPRSRAWATAYLCLVVYLATTT